MTDNKTNERAFAGSLLFDPDKVLKVATMQGLTKEHFTDETSRLIYGAALRLQEQSKPIDSLTIKQESGVDIAIVQKLIDDSPTAAHAEYYAKQIQGEYLKSKAVSTLKSAEGAEGIRLALDTINDTLPKLQSNTGYSVRSWGECVDIELPEKRYFLGNLFACGQLQAIFGQGGLGKSRLGTNLARNQVLGLPFLDQPTGKPLKHLFVGSENDIYRWQIDARAMSKGLSKEQVDSLSDNIHMTTLEHCDDVSINLADDIALNKWKDTLRSWPPDVLWVDPWGDIIIGDSISDNNVRETIRTLRKLATAVNPDCGIVILAHSRTGIANIIQAGGLEAANFGKDSKALYSGARAVVNIAPYDGTDNPDLVWIPSKINNGKRPESIRITLDSDTLTYSRVDSLDVEEWQASIKAAGRGNTKRPEPEIDADSLKAIFSDGAMPKLILEDKLQHKGFTVRGAKTWIVGMIDKDQLIEKKSGTKNQKLIGTPENF